MKSPLLHLIVWLCICAGTLAAYGYWYAIVSGESSAVADLQNQITAKTQASARLASTRAALAEISGDESLVDSYFVTSAGVVPFIDGLQALASSEHAQMKVLSVSTAGSAAQNTLQLLLTVSIDGTFDSVLHTVGAIEYAPYDLTLSQLSVEKQSKNSWHADLEAAIGSVGGGASSTPVGAHPSP